MAQSKEQKIKNTLARHREHFDEKMGTVLITDFYQLSQVLENLRETDQRSFNAFYALVLKNIELEEIVRERGARIAKLQRGQTQPR